MATILDYMEKTPVSGNPVRKSSANVLKPQLDSNIGKKIMHNMESVMKSLKRKHKHKKHRKKKATKALEVVVTVNVGDSDKNPDDSDEEEQPLANLKTTWLCARPRASPAKTAESSPPDKKNAFTMLMTGKGSTPEAVGNDENQTQKASPPVGKRKLSTTTVQKDQIKRRKLKSTDASPKSPVKKRRKKKLFECYVETIEPKKSLSEQPVQIDGDSEVEILTPSRPRRSCATNVSYAETSPTSTKSISSAATKLISSAAAAAACTITEPDSITIDLLQDASKSATKEDEKKAAKKLAPLFVKSLPKPSVDPKILEARQSFLKSDIPEKMRLDMEKKKVAQEEANTRQLCLFPEISHVPMPPKELYLAIYDDHELFPRIDPSQSSCNSPPIRTYSLLKRNSNETDEPTVDLHPVALTVLKTDVQKKQIARSLRKEFEDVFPSDLLYKSLSKKQKSTSEEDSLFTEKFKPSSSREFLFNLREIAEVKEYLESFVLPQTNEENNGSSYDTDDDECSNSMDAFGNNNGGYNSRPTLVLHGASSTGKTSSVYAIANELNCNVIEINASAKRNGSQLLHRVMEATQSHKVPTAKMSLNRKILRRMERAEKRMSIILIEDVDVIFPEDTGFLAAITQLMSLTKRPIILTTNNRNSPGLKKTFESSANFKFLEFHRPGEVDIESCFGYLQLVGVVCGASIDRNYLRGMFEACQGDLRQAMFQLNFITLTREIDLDWTTLKKQSELALPCCDLQSAEAGEKEGSEDLLRDLAWTLDNLCVAETWTRRGGSCERSTEMFSLGRSLLAKRFDTIERGYPELDTDAANEISNYTNRYSIKLPSRVTALDVEPILRNVCRSERSRKDGQRSSSKFMHYLLREREDCPAFGAQRSTNEDLQFFNRSCSVFKP